MGMYVFFDDPFIENMKTVGSFLHVFAFSWVGVDKENIFFLRKEFELVFSIIFQFPKAFCSYPLKNSLPNNIPNYGAAIPNFMEFPKQYPLKSTFPLVPNPHGIMKHNNKSHSIRMKFPVKADKKSL
jgi:hypothetical protein